MKPPFSYGFPMVFLWFSYGFPMVFLNGTVEKPVGIWESLLIEAVPRHPVIRRDSRRLSHGKTIGKPWENHGKMVGLMGFNGI